MHYIGFQMLATYQLLSSSSVFWLIHHAHDVDCFCYQICINQKSVTLAYFLLTLLEYLRSSSVFSGGFVTRSLVLCVCFVFRCLSFCPFSLGHCVVCPFSMYGFWLPHLYLQTHLQIYCGSFFHFSFFFQNKNNFVLSSFNVYTFISVYSFFSTPTNICFWIIIPQCLQFIVITLTYRRAKKNKLGHLLLNNKKKKRCFPFIYKIRTHQVLILCFSVYLFLERDLTDLKSTCKCNNYLFSFIDYYFFA